MSDFLKKNHPFAMELDTSIELAKAAGELISTIRKKGYRIQDKGFDLGLVTEADQAASQLLVRELKHYFPNDLLVSEEEPLPAHKDTQRIWFIDPIDGTNEFIAGSEDWSIMIGLTVEGRPQLGVVYQPDLDNLYYAVKHAGACLVNPAGKKHLSVRDVIDPKRATLIQSRSHWSTKADHLAKQLQVSDSFQMGSIGLKFGQIAQGNADFYFNFSKRCHFWDLCAPEIILEEAGGVVVTAISPTIAYRLGSTQIKENFLASNPLLAKKLRHYLT
ncbi:3'(2'),5'-bisphosphate nucleotidase CysQ family protein [Legionella jordanis]|nr:3'(2'),5'-bisphosphate nucleotidase CysQ [Legionella jordanis]RMW99844.1 3'(2'),5'-bisphosphate nucleotidase CysQ [Legionella jordanis]